MASSDILSGMEMVTRVCIDCEKEKPLEDFHKVQRGKTYYKRRCRPCNNAKCYQKRLDKFANQPGYREAFLADQRNRKKIQMYGVTLEEFNRKAKEQNHCCKICGKKRKLVIDHHHDTNTVRDLLCGPCNSALGLMCEDVEILKQAIRYLRTHRSDA